MDKESREGIDAYLDQMNVVTDFNMNVGLDNVGLDNVDFGMGMDHYF